MGKAEYDDESGITREKFRELIDPMLEGLGLKAEQVKTCYFDVDGFKFELFHLDDKGNRVLATPVTMPNLAGGLTHFNSFAKVHLTVHVSEPRIVRDLIAEGE